ncbi:MAG: hypothetical protein M0R22_07645 [Dehalococcoidia bacterium]|jgi:hypothetical protein|nr:hypothetical protein [Dehalococcoidia bacterium]
MRAIERFMRRVDESLVVERWLAQLPEALVAVVMLLGLLALACLPAILEGAL